MDPVTLVVGALAAGALKGVGDSASSAVQEAYQRLRQVVSTRFVGHPAAEVVLAEHENDPATYEAPLTKHLRESGVGEDGVVIEAAQDLMGVLDEAGSRRGKYLVDLRNSQGVQIGDFNTQENTF